MWCLKKPSDNQVEVKAKSQARLFWLMPPTAGWAESVQYIDH